MVSFLNCVIGCFSQESAFVKDLRMLAVLLLRLFRKQHEKYPWEMSMSDTGGATHSLDQMQPWSEKVDEASDALSRPCTCIYFYCQNHDLVEAESANFPSCMQCQLRRSTSRLLNKHAKFSRLLQ